MVKLSPAREVEYVFKSPDVAAEPQFTILFPSIPNLLPCDPHVNSWFEYDQSFLVPLWGQQLSKALNSELDIFKSKTPTDVKFIKSPGFERLLKFEFVRSIVMLLPLETIPLFGWLLLPDVLSGDMSKLLEPYDDDSSSDFEQAWMYDNPKKAKVIVGQVFFKNFI